MSESIYDIEVETIDGQTKTLDEYKGKVMLVVNTASKCGFTPQYKGLEELHKTYAERGLAVLGFPCNQFGSQEPGDGDEIQSFCQLNYGVSFPMHAKVEVNGDGSHPLFQRLKTSAKGMFGTQNIKWNFTKFLIDREGKVVGRFAPTTTPARMASQIEELLG